MSTRIMRPTAVMAIFVCLLTAHVGVAQETTTSFSIEPGFTLGDDPDEPVEAFFDQPALVSVDSKGNIFVADRGGLEIKMFDPNGSFLRAFGGEGSAPGEYQTLTGLTVSPTDEVVVVDGRSRRVTFIDSESGEVRTGGIDVKTNLEIAPYGDRFFVASNDFYGSDDVDLVAEYDGRMQRTAKIANGEEVLPDKDDLLVQSIFLGDPGSIAVISKDSVIYAPTLYDGRVYLYTRASSEGLWAREQLRGTSYKPALTRLNSTAREADVVTRYRGSDFKAMLHGESRGLFSLRGGRIVHFAVLERQDRVVFVAELMTRSGDLVGTHELLSKPLRRNVAQTIRWQVAWGDGEGNFLVIDREEVPVVRRLEMSVLE